MTCLWVDIICLTENAHMIMQKYVSYLVKKFTRNTSLVVIPFLCSELRLRTLANWNHPPYLWKNPVIIYLMKVISMLALLLQIFVLFFNLFLQKMDIFILYNHMGSHRWLHKAVFLCIKSLSTIMYYFIFFYS